MPPPPNEAETAPAGALAVLDGPALARAFAGGAAALRRQAGALNAINVFPVPDGDTGTNMSLTMRAAVDAVERAGDASVAGVAKAASQGSLMGAKGNSGVILSQILGGFTALPPDAALDGAALAGALECGRAASYRVISNPKEGTILTAITAAASAAADRARGGEGALDTMAAIVESTREAVARTPELLPVLKEAGVVDAGAQGLFVLFDGMLRALRGEEPAAAPADFGAIDESWLNAREKLHGEGEQAGFCTEFVIETVDDRELDADTIRARLQAMGESLLVIGNGGLVRVHLHTLAPDDALAYGRTLGTLSHEKVEDMEQQFQALAARRREQATATAAGVAVVAVGAGDGIERLLRSIGAVEVIRGGQTMNPSAGDIRAAIEATGARDVIVLPDNKNVILAAQLAAAGLPGAGVPIRVRVVPSRSIPQGVAALIAMNPEASFDDNAAAMEQAIACVHTGEVTHAARATHVHGMAISEGQPIGLVDGDLVVAEATVADAVRRCVAIMVEGRDASLVTLYAGEGETAAAAEAIAAALRGAFNVDVEVVAGGQPHYPYLIGVE
jgi:DAK2 domain fusion protein YloV